MEQQSKSASSEREPSRLLQLFASRAFSGRGLAPDEALIALAGQLRRRTARAKTSDQRLQALLKKRHIAKVEVVCGLECEGMLQPHGTTVADGFTVRLNRGSNEYRRLFSLAHEICHTFFYEFVPELKFVPHGVDEDEERLCDLGAAEILMPGTPVRRAAVGRSECLEHLRDLADEFGVSLSAMFLRLRALKLWRSELSRWHRTKGGSFLLHRLYGGKLVAWKWADDLVLERAWSSRRAVSGSTYISHENERGVTYCKPVSYQVQRAGGQVIALWGTRIRVPERYSSTPLFEGTSKLPRLTAS